MSIPCKECIVFPVCKQKVRLWTNPPDLTTFSRMIDCKDFYDYIISIYDSVGINELRKLYGLPKLPHLRNPARDLVVLDKQLYDNGIIQIVSRNNCDCNIAELNKKDCEHEIIAGNELPKPPKEV